MTARNAAAWLPAMILAFSPQAMSMPADEIPSGITDRFPGIGAENVQPTPVPGLYEMRLEGMVLYISADGRYVLQGDLFDAETETNLTEKGRIQARMAAIDGVSESSMIVFAPKSAASHTITVFTDIDCGYCRKLHRQIADYNSEGIAVRYLFYPRSGPNTESWSKADNVWCADDRQAALTRAKAGQTVQSGDCGMTPVAQHYALGETIGIRGTPAIVTETGELIPGYVSPGELLDILENGY